MCVVVSREVYVIKCYRILAFDDYAFRLCRFQCCVADRYVCGGINSRGALAVCYVSSAVNIYGSAASVRSDRS